MDSATVQLLTPLVAALASGGAAFMGIKASLNGQKERLVRVEEKVDVLVVDVAKLNERNLWHDRNYE